MGEENREWFAGGTCFYSWPRDIIVWFRTLGGVPESCGPKSRMRSLRHRGRRFDDKLSAGRDVSGTHNIPGSCRQAGRPADRELDSGSCIRACCTWPRSSARIWACSRMAPHCLEITAEGDAVADASLGDHKYFRDV